ncbi:MAG: adenylyl-sulfate kinase [Alphaproteobacteria bacterium]|nr:adenylyl-sulfate kinase [Alphaproteobacteria bacterium]
MDVLAAQFGQEPQCHREQMKIVIVGHVDHGKSTLIGRLFHDTDSLPDGKFEQIQMLCKKRGMPFEWSFLMDALQAERDQGITIDTSQIWFKTPLRDYVIIDAPGHKEFLKNMISGAANSEAALLIIDAKEGVKEQSKRHGYLLHLLGVRQIAVAVNKMDLVGYDENVFRQIEQEYREYLKDIGVVPTYIIPISAREGDNIIKTSDKMKWYTGPAVIEALDHFKKQPASAELPLRFPVQDVYKFDERRIIAGRIESGSIRVGDNIIFSPTNKMVKVKSIESWNGSRDLPTVEHASAGMSVGITLEDQIFVERGHVISHVQQAPFLTNIFRARIFWLDDKPLVIGERYKLKINTSSYEVEVKEIERVVDTSDLGHHVKERVERNDVAEVIFRIKGLAAMDSFNENADTGRFMLVRGFRPVGGGIIDLYGFTNQRVDVEIKSKNIHAVDIRITPEQRALRNGHKGGVLWFSGLSGSGKTTLALELQQHLFNKGYHVYVLDGDNIRGGLSADLGFAPEDRSENIRRVSEVAALFANAGMIVITAFISPYRQDRHRARTAAPSSFHSIYIKADVATCEKRDPKGLYQKARKGEIKEFTGISAPYEEPDNPDLIVDTENCDILTSVKMLLDYVEKNLVESVADLDAKATTGSGI